MPHRLGSARLGSARYPLKNSFLFWEFRIDARARVLFFLPVLPHPRIRGRPPPTQLWRVESRGDGEFNFRRGSLFIVWSSADFKLVENFSPQKKDSDVRLGAV